MTKDDPNRISLDFSEAPTEHNILVIGSGYGGGVAASRLARTGQKVTVLERGREIRPGQYPKDMKAGLSEFQTTLSNTGETYGKDYGLYDFRISDNVNVFVGCGLGGTSLINANVAIEPDPSIFKDWPKPYCDAPDLLKDYYARARDMLGSQPYPKDRSLPKLDALETVAKGLDARFDRPDINVTFEEGLNKAGVWQMPCTDCGDCVSGCNYGAKNTVLMNYLPDAKKALAEIFVGADVQTISKTKDGWEISVKDTASGKIKTLNAKMVILAAGTLGSTEILLRSQSKELQFSKKLGEQFSTNGDIWAFGCNANIREDSDAPRDPLYCVGAGDRDLHTGLIHDCLKPGPCITGIVDLRDPSKPLDQNIIIQEGVMPGALAPLYAGMYPFLDALKGDQFRFGDMADRLNDVAELGDALIKDPLNFADTVYSGPVSRTMPYLVMGHDTSAGELRLNHDRVHVHWPDAGKNQNFSYSSKTLRKASDNIKAEYIPMPMWEDAFNNRVFCVHPLGGCAMGETVKEGVVNANCQVFDPNGSLHDDLYVVDGAVIPKALGVNPHLTITAVAERAMDELTKEKQWEIHWDPAKPDPKPDSSPNDGSPQKKISFAVSLLNGIKATINNGEDVSVAMDFAWTWLEGKYDELDEEIKKLLPIPTAQQVVDYFRDLEVQKTSLLPLVEQLLSVLEPLNAALQKQDYKKIIDHLEDVMGDFSPRLWFPEKMVGHVSVVGLNDNVKQHDPYGVAGMGPENFEFAAHITAPSVRQAIAETGDFSQITGTVTWKDTETDPREFDVDGTFKFLVPNEDEVECWNMIYEGTMTPTNYLGERLSYRGFKVLQYRPGSHPWTDLTELYFDISSSTPFDEKKIIARGVLKLGLEDVITQANKLEIKYQKPKLFSFLLDAYDEFATAIRREKPNDIPDVTANPIWRAKIMKGALFGINEAAPNLGAIEKTEQLYWAKALGRMGFLVLRTYGKFLSYMANFQAEEITEKRPIGLPEPQIYKPITEDGAELLLTRYKGGTKGPVIMAVGLGANSSAFSTPTIDPCLAKVLCDDGFDVWLFDYRGSGCIEASLKPFTQDDVATKDWPAAIDLILEETGAKDVQVVVHCVGSLIFFMAVLYGETRIRSIIASQLGPHPLINWFKHVQSDSEMTKYLIEGFPEHLWPLFDAMGIDDYEFKNIVRNGLGIAEPTSPSKTHRLLGDERTDLDQIIDGMLWNVPNFAPVPCNSPTCHRINFFFGPTYQHDQINQATHNAIKDMFGPVSSNGFEQVLECFKAGQAVSKDPNIDYMKGVKNLSMPVHFIVGAKNPLIVPECSLRTIDWLKEENGNEHLYTREVYQGFGHIDCIIGKNAHEKIFPDICKRLNETAKPTAG